MVEMNQLRYISTEQLFEGIIVEVHDASVTIDLKGRLGQLKIPRRMIISEHNLELGQVVGFLMTYPEVIEENPDTDYVDNILKVKRRKEENRKRFDQIRKEDTHGIDSV